MFKHNIKYTDFNGVERAEDFYFHLSLPEVTRLEASLGKPLEQYAREMAAENDPKKLLTFIEKLILDSYGKKTEDGRSFRKSAELRSEFEYSQPYAELFEQMLTDPSLAEKFGTSVADNGKRKNQVTPRVVEDQPASEHQQG